MDMSTPNDPTRLSPADADALDALVEAGFELDRVPPFQRARAERLAAILGLLDVPSTETVQHHDQPDLAPTAVGAELAPADRAALDDLVESDWSVSKVAAPNVARAGRMASVLSVLDTPSRMEQDIDGDALIDATLAQIQRSERLEQVAQISTRRRFRVPFTDIASAAAILLIATSILWPMLTGIRRDNIQTANAARLATAGLGFSMYANDHRGELPTAPNSLAGRAPGVTWWNVGEPRQSHSANLFALVKGDYASLEDLASPANPHAPVRLDVEELDDWRSPEEVSYSYQLLGPDAIRWTTPSRQVVLSDRSPVIEVARHGYRVDPMMNSLTHRGVGQHVLFNDRSVQWLDSPVTSWGDNIWLPRSLERRLKATLHGVELPDGEDDAFVGP